MATDDGRDPAAGLEAIARFLDHESVSMGDDLREIAAEFRRLRTEQDALRAVLGRLVAAEDEKERNGETHIYRALKAGAWDHARMILAGGGTAGGEEGRDGPGV